MWFSSHWGMTLDVVCHGKTCNFLTNVSSKIPLSGLIGQANEYMYNYAHIDIFCVVMKILSSLDSEGNILFDEWTVWKTWISIQKTKMFYRKPNLVSIGAIIQCSLQHLETYNSLVRQSIKDLCKYKDGAGRNSFLYVCMLPWHSQQLSRKVKDSTSKSF